MREGQSTERRARRGYRSTRVAICALRCTAILVSLHQLAARNVDNARRNRLQPRRRGGRKRGANCADALDVRAAAVARERKKRAAKLSNDRRFWSSLARALQFAALVQQLNVQREPQEANQLVRAQVSPRPSRYERL